MRKIKFAIGEYYHIYNRGTDKRDVFLSKDDMERFFLCMSAFNTSNPVGSIFELHHSGKNAFGSPTPKFGSRASKHTPPIEFVAYCLNQNHYHFIVRQVAEDGISKFMQRLGTGYTNYFNEKYERSGVLFQGKYKAKHIASNEYLLHVTAYVNLNFKVHSFGSPAPKMYMSSWGEYIGKEKRQFCTKDIILGQFTTRRKYEMFCEKVLPDIIKRKEDAKESADLFLEAGLPK